MGRSIRDAKGDSARSRTNNLAISESCKSAMSLGAPQTLLRLYITMQHV